MNGPAFAGILTASAVMLLVWSVWAMWKARSALWLGGTFASWFLPMFYFGGWAAGATIGMTTLTLLTLSFLYLLGWMRDAALTKTFNRYHPQGPEVEIRNLDTKD